MASGDGLGKTEIVINPETYLTVDLIACVKFGNVIGFFSYKELSKMSLIGDQVKETRFQYQRDGKVKFSDRIYKILKTKNKFISIVTYPGIKKIEVRGKNLFKLFHLENIKYFGRKNMKNLYSRKM